jgi:hypothetical protein
MTFDEATRRLVALAQANGGTVTAAQVEADEELAAERDLVCAAARALGGGTNVFSAVDEDGREWFPYSTLTFAELPQARR